MYSGFSLILFLSKFEFDFKLSLQRIKKKTSHIHHFVQETYLASKTKQNEK